MNTPVYHVSTVLVDTLEDLEDILLSADVGVAASQRIVARAREVALTQRSPDLRSIVQEEMLSILRPCETPYVLSAKPYVVLVVGVNGVGKTTTVAKMAAHFDRQGKKVMLAAADTFRVATRITGI